MSSRRRVWQLAWPLILSNSTVPLLGIVDSAVVGHLPDPAYLGAVGLGAVTFSALYLLFSSVRMGTTALTAQAVGADNVAEIKASLLRPLGLALVTGGVLIALAPLIGEAAVRGFAPAVSVDPHLRDYIQLRILGAPAALANFVILGWLLGNQNTRSQLVVMVTITSLNAILDLLFVFGLGWDVAGVAAATAVSQWVGLGVGGLFVVRIWRRLPEGFSLQVFWQRSAFRRLFQVNGDLIIRTLILESTFVVFAALSARQGEVILAANTLLENFLMLQAYALDGFAFAAEALVGRAAGRRAREELAASVVAAGRWALQFAVAIALAYALLGTYLIQLMTSIPSVSAAAHLYLPYLVISPLISAWAYLYDGVFSGAIQTRELRNGTFIATALFLSTALPLIALLGNHGLWLALLGFKLTRSLWFRFRYRRLMAAGVFIH